MTKLSKHKFIMDDIKKNYGINLIENNCTFFEHQLIPLDKKFYNRIFTIEIKKPYKIIKTFKRNNNKEYYKGNKNLANNNNNLYSSNNTLTKKID